MKYVLDAEFLIAAQFAAQSVREEVLVLNLSCEFLRQAVHRVSVAKQAGNQLLHGVVVLDRLLLEIIPCVAF